MELKNKFKNVAPYSAKWNRHGLIFALSDKEATDFIQSPDNLLARKLREKLATGSMLFFARLDLQVLESLPSRWSYMYVRTLSLDNLRLSLMTDNIDATFATKQFDEIGDTSFHWSDRRVHIEIFICRWW